MQTPSRVIDRYNKAFQRAVQLLAVLSFVGLFVIVYGHVFSNGLCCADDSTNAVVAKNFALGKGYLNSIRFDGLPGGVYFDPQITTGPTLNLPAAAVIYIAGNVPWAPGFVTATMSLVLIVLIAVSLRRLASPSRVAAFICLWIFLLYSVTAGLHFEHWYSLIGEIPAALICVLGAVVLAVNPNKRSMIVASGLLYGFAVLTKLLALLAFVPVVIWLVYRAIVARHDRGRRVVDCLVGGTAFAAPFAAFEIWKLSVLGPTAYVQNAHSFFLVFSTYSGTVGSGKIATFVGAALHKYAVNSAVLRGHFGYSPIVILATAVVVMGLTGRYCEERGLRLLVLWTLGAALVDLTWWLISSNGWPRYALIGLFLYFTGVSCMVFIRLSRIVLGSLIVLLACVFWVGTARLMDPVKFVLTYKYSYTPRVVNLLKTAAVLNGLRQDEPFVMGWWATAGDIEYALPTVDNFVQSDHVGPDPSGRDLILARNKVWVAWGTTPGFTAWEQRCSAVVLDAPPYLVSRCPPEAK